MNATAQHMDRAVAAEDSDNSRRALYMLWLSLFFFLMATAVGLGWDRRWHATHVFNTFYSPPHLFIYGMLALSFIAMGAMTVWPSTRREFGGAVLRLPLVGAEVPGALALAGAGVAVVMVAGAFDDLWHSNFGLDETSWSFPHAMLGTGFELVFIGILACRLALAGRRPITTLGWWLLGSLLLLFSLERIVGPLSQASPDMVKGIAAIPTLAIQAPFQHTMRIYEQWDLNRTNWLFVPAAALATGMGLGLVWRFARRGWILLAVALVRFMVSAVGDLRTARYFGLQHDPRNWLPVPVLPAAAAFLVARRLGAGERTAWLVAGAAFGVGTLVWDPHLVLLPVAAAAMVVGAEAALRVWRVVERPTTRSVALLALLFGMGAPALTGALDLYLRSHTP